MSICRFVAAACAATLLAGCAGSIERWIVNTRVHQGDVAMLHGDVHDAALAYRLALRVDPKDPKARAGYVDAAAEVARLQYSKGSFDDALETVDAGLSVDSQSAPLAALKAAIEQAKLQREIVLTNYPTYHTAGLEIQRSYAQLNSMNGVLLRNLKRFGYTFDTDQLTAAIKRSYEMELELTKDTNRLIVYRQLVSSGVPETPAESTTFGAASLLPLP